MANQRWETAGCLRVVAGSIKLECNIELFSYVDFVRLSGQQEIQVRGLYRQRGRLVK